jgi:membrane protease YdiL (CAAX protease family)
MRIGRPSGLQITFFIFAVALLAVPATRLLLAAAGWHAKDEPLVSRIFMFGFFILLVALIRPLRQVCRQLLSVPIPRSSRAEVVVVSLLHATTSLAVAAALALWFWLRGGEDAVVANLAQKMRLEDAIAVSMTIPALMLLFVATFVGPVVEELVFREFLFTAWRTRLGWLAAMLLSGIVFGLVHPIFISAFAAAIFLSCIYLRTGSLWAPITVHAVHNLALWHPLLGQFVFPPTAEAATRLSSWYVHIACLALTLVALPTYVWMTRHQGRRSTAAAIAGTNAGPTPSLQKEKAP